MITSLLPGVRELRAPLTAGALLLAALYIGFQSIVADIADSASAGQPVENLVNQIGDKGWVIVASVGAYLIGTIFVAARNIVTNRVAASQLSWATSRRYLYERGPTRWEKLIAPFSRPSLRRMGMLQEPTYDPKLPRQVGIEIIFGGGKRLLVANQTLHGEYDRLRSEAEFGAAVALPLTIFTITSLTSLRLSSQSEFLLVLVEIAVAVVLLIQARFLDRQANSVYAHAVADGTVSVSILDSPDKVHRRRWGTAVPSDSDDSH